MADVKKFYYVLNNMQSQFYKTLGDAYGEAIQVSKYHGSGVLVTLYVQVGRVIVELAKFRNSWEVKK